MAMGAPTPDTAPPSHQKAEREAKSSPSLKPGGGGQPAQPNPMAGQTPASPLTSAHFQTLQVLRVGSWREQLQVSCPQPASSTAQSPPHQGSHLGPEIKTPETVKGTSRVCAFLGPWWPLPGDLWAGSQAARLLVCLV